MTRRPGPPTKAHRFVGNSNKMEVHDLDNEQTEKNRCQIDEIIAAGHAVIFEPDSLAEAHRQGFDNCEFCLGKSLW
jgi:hypothetical protein